MRNPFKAYQEYVKKTPRNSFDLSHLNNMTLPYGLLVPDLVLDVTAGDSAQIDASFAFNFLPTMFPVQTPIRINQYFFYVRYRNCMENYEDFRYGNKSDIVHPYLKQPASFFKTCGLADYMGIPTTLAVGEHGNVVFPLDGTTSFMGLRPGPRVTATSTNLISVFGNSISQSIASSGSIGASASTRATSYFVSDIGIQMMRTSSDILISSQLWGLSSAGRVSSSTTLNYAFCIKSIDLPLHDDGGHGCAVSLKLYGSNAFVGAISSATLVAVNSRSGRTVSLALTGNTASYESSSHLLVVNINSSSVESLNDVLQVCEDYDLYVILDGVDYGKFDEASCFVLDYGASVDIVASRPIDIGEHPELNPFCSVNGADPLLRINALPFRAYEQIYNAYFRNERVEPFMKNGVVEYNDFGTTYADGPDTTPYELKHRNWELDMLSSCLLTPQQGAAPIVGVDSRRITFSDGENNYNFLYQTNDDGTLAAEGSRFEEENVPGSVRSRAVDLIANGFTIESLREANAMQLWVEKNIRRGLRYRDQLKAHTGIDLDYDELELPEFLGGFSKYVDVNSVTSSAGTSDAVLGDVAGKLSCFKQANHKISHFFREDGVVLGLICIVPQPVYSQMLPKFYLRTDAMDYYNAVFSHMGMQPVPYKEVAPVQMMSEINSGGTRTMDSTFGYNRPNYDMVSMSDEVHGLMRTTDKDFVLMRVFDGVPELGASFLHVDGKQLNDVFTITDDDGHIARGQVAFKIYMKRPVPSVGEPRLQ